MFNVSQSTLTLACRMEHCPLLSTCHLFSLIVSSKIQVVAANATTCHLQPIKTVVASSREVAAPRQPSPTTVNIASSKLDTETLHLDSRPVPQYSVKKGVLGFTFQHIGDHPHSLRSEDVDDQRTLNLIRQVSNGSAISVEVQDTTLPD